MEIPFDLEEILSPYYFLFQRDRPGPEIKIYQLRGSIIVPPTRKAHSKALLKTGQQYRKIMTENSQQSDNQQNKNQPVFNLQEKIRR